jgi:predicted RNase H-like HicB family nuclease
MKTEQLEFTANVHAEDDGTYWAEVAELPGCFASGHDLDELKDGLAEAIQMCLPEVANGSAAPAVNLSALRMLVASDSR